MFRVCSQTVTHTVTSLTTRHIEEENEYIPTESSNNSPENWKLSEKIKEDPARHTIDLGDLYSQSLELNSERPNRGKDARKDEENGDDPA